MIKCQKRTQSRTFLVATPGFSINYHWLCIRLKQQKNNQSINIVRHHRIHNKFPIQRSFLSRFTLFYVSIPTPHPQVPTLVFGIGISSIGISLLLRGFTRQTAPFEQELSSSKTGSSSIFDRNSTEPRRGMQINIRTLFYSRKRWRRRHSQRK